MVVRPKDHQPLLKPLKVDELVNAVFTAFTHDLGRPFIAGGRNVRSVVKQWDPLSHESLPADWTAFLCNYAPAHFFDRYLYSAEVDNTRVLEDQALDLFKKNLGRGYLANDWKLRFLPYGELNSILMSASLEAHRILGDFDVERWYSLCTHGPNATVGVRRDEAYLPQKFKALDGTLPAISLFKDYLEWNPHMREYLGPLLSSSEVSFTEVAGSQLNFVPKKFDKLRTMMKEPTINQFLQLGLGAYIQSQLAAFGNINLSDQPEVHRQLVRLITKHDLPIATIDWSQASDRIWLELCRIVLPSDWFAVLSDVRSPVTTYRGETYQLTMAGSMGCGFTFPLQTLLFLTLLRATARERGHEEFVSVFGDDCVVDASMMEDIAWLARELDWQMNADKSFSEGPFRESCGVDAFRGMDVRPFFIERPTNVLSSSAICAWAYGVYNQCARVVSRVPGKTPKALITWLGGVLGQFNHDLYPVPSRFSETSGVQVDNPFDPEFIELTRGIAVSPVLENYFYPYCGFHFSFIGPRRKRVETEQHPYFIWTLMGKGIPQDFKRAQLCLDEDPEVNEFDKLARVPKKGNPTFVTKPGFVYSWAY
jgi:hypothetical protein